MKFFKTPQRIFFVLTLVVLLAINSLHAQQLSLLEVSAVTEEERTVFNLEFETPDTDVNAQVKSGLNGYDSILVDSYQFVQLDGTKTLKISSYLFNPETNQKLRWLTKGDYVEQTKRPTLNQDQLLSGKFIQFGAFNNYDYATNLSQQIREFDIEIIRIEDLYKLVAPYSLDDYKKARKIYKDAWPVEYKKASQVVSN